MPTCCIPESKRRKAQVCSVRFVVVIVFIASFCHKYISLDITSVCVHVCIPVRKTRHFNGVVK